MSIQHQSRKGGRRNGFIRREEEEEGEGAEGEEEGGGEREEEGEEEREGTHVLESVEVLRVHQENSSDTGIETQPNEHEGDQRDEERRGKGEAERQPAA